jgi:predicted TIM-barrel fold metal-dependent hydrolase
LNVRNVQRKNPITKEQADYLDHKGSYLPEPRLRDMDIQGIDQVMIIPTDFEAYPWIQNAAGARAMCKAYNDWAYEYCQADPERLYFAGLLPMQDATFAAQELYRVADKGCRVGLIRPIDALGNYPIQPKYGRVWRAMEETGVVYGMHPFPCLGVLKPPGYTEQCSGSELIALTASSAELPHNFLTNVQNFQAEASLWVTMALMSGFFERYPKIKAAVPMARREKQISLYTSPEKGDLEKLQKAVGWIKDPAEAIKPLTDVIDLIEDDQQSKQMLRTIIDDELATIKWFRETLTLLSASPAA